MPTFTSNQNILKKTVLFLLMFLSSFCLAQHTEDFRQIKKYYNTHRALLGKEFRKKFDSDKNTDFRKMVRQDYQLFMHKMDSIENVALVGALLKAKNLEDLQKIQRNAAFSDPLKSAEDIAITTEKTAEYPGGLLVLQKEIADNFYDDGFSAEQNPLKTTIAFVVERDGSISNVKSLGENPVLNRQAEIALYSLSQKFFPAQIKGQAVRSVFRLPLAFTK